MIFTLYKFVHFWASSLAALFLLMLYQASYSVAPIMLAFAIKSQDHKLLVMFCIGYIVLNFLPYPLAYGAHVFLKAWKLSASAQIAKDVQARYEKQYGLLNLPNIENKYKAMVSNNSQSIALETIDYIYGLSSFIFSSLLSLIFISLFVVPEIAISYAISFVGCFIVILWVRKKQAHLSKRSERLKNKFIGGLADAWSNNILAQEPFWGQQQKKIDGNWNLYRLSSMRVVHYFQKTSMVQAFIIWLPTSILFLSMLSTSNFIEAAALLVILPRIIELLLDISNFVMNVLEFSVYKGRLTWLEQETLSLDEEDLTARIRFEEITLKSSAFGTRKIKSVSEVVELLESGNGRVQVLGANGSGKSSLLTLLKCHYREAALLLPSTLSIFAAIRRQKSTGQLKIAEIEEIERESLSGQYQVILLDEWNANLDESKRAYIESVLERLGDKVSVVEAVNWRVA